MRPSRRRLPTARTWCFESFEPRLVMSSNLGLDAEYYAENLQAEVQPLATGSSDPGGIAQLKSQYGFTAAGQTVVVIDSGIAYTHTALGGGYGAGYRVVGGYDFAERDDNPYDDGPFGAHGTHVAGILASSDSQHPGLATGVDLVSLRVFDDAGHGEFAWVEEALSWVHQHLNSFAHPITTVNLSLGGTWNSTGLPSWASLEDELAQLEADGLFISVAAGNSFADYNTPGLSYPAASSHVVPVASVDANGQLSYYSQRDSRAIAAPGRGIESTVPDYLGNGNGVDDDFAAFSGTSMAAPYVAAASALLRQAYQFVGVGSVNQEMLYNLMRNTADTVYDSVTGQNYLRLNLASALASIMPGDDFGSSAATAYQLGTISGPRSVSGAIARMDDRDYFQFTAAATGTVTLSLQAADQLRGRWELVGSGGAASSDGSTFTFHVVAGQSYTVGLGTIAGLGHYSFGIAVDTNSTPTDHAPGGQQEILNQSINAAGKWLTLSTVNSGIFTVLATFANRAGDVDMELFDAQGNYLGGSYGTGNRERIDVAVAAGQSLSLHVYLNGSGVNGDVDLKVTNLVSQTGSTVTVLGTDGDDIFTFSAGSTRRLSINGVEYTFESAKVTAIQFNGFLGSDSAVLQGTAGNETVRLRPGAADLQGQGYRVQTSSTETVAFSGDGGQDLAILYDSAGNDTFDAHPGVASLSGDGFSIRVDGVASIRAMATGGIDTANLYDSSGNDVLSVAPGYGRLGGSGYSLLVRDFENTHAFSTAGGRDVATFSDSAGNDTFVGDPTLARFWTGRFYTDATQFEAVTVLAVAGGYDTATLSDSAGDDVFLGRPSVARLAGPGYAYCLKQFDAVEAKASSGRDVAYLYDSAGDDTFVSTPESSKLYGTGFSLQASGFGTVQGLATAGGLDTAWLYGSGGNDTLVAGPCDSSLSGANYVTRVRYFEQVQTFASDREDQATLYDSAADDHLVVTADQVRLSNQDYAVWVYGLERISARSLAGGADTAERGVLDCVLDLVGDWR